MLLKKCLPLFLCLPPLVAQGPLARDSKTVVAVADGKNITWGEVQEMMLTAPPNIVAALQTDPKAALMNMLLMQHLGKEGLERHLDQESPTKEQIELMRLQILANARLNQEVNTYQPTPEMIQKYYESHLNQYQRVRATGIMIRFKPEAKAGATSSEDVKNMAIAILQGGSVQRSEADALKIANDVAKQWREGGDAEALAAKYSEDEPSKPLGGDLGFISVKSHHADELRNAAMSMVPKTISDPIRLPAGFFVIRVEDRSPIPLKDVQLEITQAVRNDHFEEWMSGLNRRFAVEIKDPTIIIQQMKPGAQPAKPAPAK